MLAPIGAMLLFTAWLALLFAGLAAGGAVHLLLVGAVGVFPWRALKTAPGGGGEKDLKDLKDLRDLRD